MAEPSAHKGAGHRQRLRERFLTAGLDGFLDYEVIELLLTLATPRKDCKAAAKKALQRFKTLPGVLEAPSGDLCQIKGIGSKNILGLKLIKAVSDRYFAQKLVHADPINNSKALFDYLYLELRHKHTEVFKIIFLNAKNRVLSSKTLFSGTLTASAVYPREVVKSALAHHAAAVIFAHNHPSGDPQPSDEDIKLTRQLVCACKTVDIHVHEHIIIGDGQYFSFADQGMITKMVRDCDY